MAESARSIEMNEQAMQARENVLAVYPKAKAVTPSLEDNWSIVADQGHARRFLSVSVFEDRINSESAAWMVADRNICRKRMPTSVPKGE